jgi:hypothetical protein
MRSPGKCIAGIAIVLILLGIATPAVYRRWLSTRTLVALDVAVSLAPGHIRTSDFGVNIDGWYQIGVDGNDEFFYRPGCRLGAVDPLLKTRSIVYRDGRAIETFDGTDRYVGHFYGEKHKQYSLDIAVLTDASCLNAGHPRVFVWTPSEDYEVRYNQLLASSIFLVLVGLGVLAFSTTSIIGKHVSERGRLAIGGNVGYAYYPSRRKVPPSRRFSRLPAFSLIYTLILASLLIPSLLIFLCAWGFDYRSAGIEVHLSKQVSLEAEGESWTVPLVVRMENAGTGLRPRLYLNSRPVAWDALGPVLRSELKSRAEWSVYFETDQNVDRNHDVDWGDVAQAMDIARGVGAKLAFIPKRPTFTPAKKQAQPQK